MKRHVCLLLALALTAAGCKSVPIKTREILFYRSDDLNDGRPCAVDIIYPRDYEQFQEITREIGPEKWFKSDLYDRVYKDDPWLERKMTRARLDVKVPEDEYMVIFAEFSNPDPNPPRGHRAYLVYEEEMQPKAKKTEYIWVHDGSLERLRKKPKRMRRDRDRDRRGRDRDSDRDKD